MIKIIIKQYTTEEYTETVNYIVKKTPTEVVEESSDYSGRRKSEIKYVEEYHTEPTKKTRTIERKLLKQEIMDESKFDLAAVIKALNGL